MKILVFFFTAYNMDEVSQDTWENAAVGDIDFGYTNKTLNPYDETAIEYALRIKDDARRLGEDASVVLVTIGENPAGTMTENLFAVGAERIFWINRDDFNPLKYDAWVSEMASAAGMIDYDCIFLGVQNSCGCNSGIGVELALELNLPYVGYVSDMEYTKGGIRVKCREERGTHEALVHVPAVYAFENTEHPYLRVATLRERLRTKNCVVENLKTVPRKETNDDVRLISLEYIPVRRSGVLIEGTSIQEKAGHLIQILRE